MAESPRGVTRLVVLLALAFAVAGTAVAGPTYKWVGCGITKKAFMRELAAAYQKKTGIKFDIQGGGATRGIRDVAAGEADMGGACRFKLADHALEDQAQLEPVAWDALVVITHPDNPVETVTLDQIRGLYLGKIRNWKALGGPDHPITLYARQGKISGVGYTIRKLVFANFEQEFQADVLVKSSGPLEQAIEKDPYAIGITGISSARKRNVKFLKVEDIEPTFENIRNGDYILYRPLYLVVNPDAENFPEMQRLIEFAHSSEGRDIIRNNGTVPYLDALKLVMKQVEQNKRAREQGLYR